MELSVDVSTDGDWGTDWLHVTLLDKDLLDLLTKKAKVTLWKDPSVLDGGEPLVDVCSWHCFLISCL